MDSKVWLGLGVAAAAGAAYYLTRPIEVDGPPKPAAKPAAKAQPKPSPKPSQRPQPRPDIDQERPALHRSSTTAVPQELQSNDLVQYENGVMTTDSLVRLLIAMRTKYQEKLEESLKGFREDRRRVGHTNREQYLETIAQCRAKQIRLFDEVFEVTVTEFGITQSQINDYNKKFGPALFYSHLERIAQNNPKPPKDMGITPEQTAVFIEDKFNFMRSLLPEGAAITQEELLLDSFIVEDMLFAKHGVEDEEIVAQSRRYKDHPVVKGATERLNSLISRN